MSPLAIAIVVLLALPFPALAQRASVSASATVSVAPIGVLHSVSATRPVRMEGDRAIVAMDAITSANTSFSIRASLPAGAEPMHAEMPDGRLVLLSEEPVHQILGRPGDRVRHTIELKLPGAASAAVVVLAIEFTAT
jgi:hypothetical protein